MRSTVADIRPNATPPVIDIEKLTFRYGALDVVNIEQFRLGAGESISVIGPSGCGKTTFLHLVAGLLKPTSGAVCLLGEAISGMDGARLDRFRGQHVGMVFQRLFLMPALTVRQNVELARQLARKPRDSARVDHLLQQLGLTEFAHHRPTMLSQGQAQRVAIARALVHSPALVLADEPTSALDDHHASQALKLLRDSTEAAGAALLVVTHDQRIRGRLDREFEMEPLR
ncbi:MAG: ABC transporter ATP-binding protein [Myxococcales bacterium FL481]|nr:MAG: ABC transporter ATP-binding protein [Myxococcales bacterium FL481]